MTAQLTDRERVALERDRLFRFADIAPLPKWAHVYTLEELKRIAACKNPYLAAYTFGVSLKTARNRIKALREYFQTGV